MMTTVTSPPRILSSMGASHLFAGEDINQRQREGHDDGGEENDVEHERAPKRKAPGYKFCPALRIESDLEAAV